MSQVELALIGSVGFLIAFIPFAGLLFYMIKDDTPKEKTNYKD